MMIVKTPFKNEKQARRELQDLSLKFSEAEKGKDLELTKRDWEVLRWICHRYGKEEIKNSFDIDFDELYEEIQEEK